MELKVLSSLAGVEPAAWNALPGARVTLSHAYLSALEESGCAAPAHGWQPATLTAWEGSSLRGALPLYFKGNSWGEFVFDWGWADAYERHGLAYYPKLVSCVPFTPVAGPRILAGDAETRALLLRGARELAEQNEVSSLHLLFPREAEAREMADAGYLLREGVQFHWRNEGYEDFTAFLAGLRHDKRKKIKSERRKVREAGITLRRVPGEEISEAEWRFFYECYLRTHELYSSPPSLNLDFFLRIGRTMPEHIFLVLAYRGGRPIASALNLYDEAGAYGRSWGALEYHPGLHFEACYYQAIEFCLERRLGFFEGGAQGEHKLARGFMPVTTWSAHWLAHPQFARAIEDFLKREANRMHLYVNELGESSPFRRDPPSLSESGAENDLAPPRGRAP